MLHDTLMLLMDLGRSGLLHAYLLVVWAGCSLLRGCLIATWLSRLECELTS